MSPLRVGLIGAGHIAAAHLAAWQRADDSTVTGIFDVDRELAAERAAQFDSEDVSALATLLDRCDVVDICTPPATHTDLLLQAVRQKKHVLIEKPIVTRLSEWDQVREESARRGSRIAVVHNLKFARAVRNAESWLRDGRIGELLHVHHGFLTDPSSDRMLSGPHWSHDLPGGRWFETLPHALYLIHTLAGALKLDRVAAFKTDNAPTGAPADEVLITFRGPGRFATVRYSANCPANRRELILQGTEGVITVDLLADSAVFHRRRDRRWERAVSGAPRRAWEELRSWVPDRMSYVAGRLLRTTPHARLIEAFALAVHGGGPWPTPVDEVDYVVRVGDRIAREIDWQLEGGGLAAS